MDNEDFDLMDELGDDDEGDITFGNMPADEMALMKAMYPDLPEYYFLNPKERKNYF